MSALNPSASTMGQPAGPPSAPAGAKPGSGLPELPPLREELRLHAGPTLPDGAPSWVIEDPVRARYFRIGWLEFELLSRWDVGSVAALIEQVSRQTTR